MPKSTRQRAHPQGTSARNVVRRQPVRIARTAAPDLSRRAQARLEMLDWYEAHGRNISLTARHYGFSRPTVYRWLGRYDRFRLETLEDRPSRPVRRRRPTWTLPELDAVRRVRLAYARWGKDKLAVLLAREGLVLSVSMVGRILERLRRTGSCGSRPDGGSAPGSGPGGGRTPCASPPGSPARPGDLVQVDTLDVRPLPGLVLKQFTARDVVSRWDVLEVRTTASARTAVAFLDALAAGCRLGFGPIQVEVTGRSSWPSSSRPAQTEGSPCRPAATEPQAQRRASSAPSAPTPRSSTRSPTPRRPWRGARSAPSSGVGGNVQHRPSPPGAGLSHAGRVPGLPRA